MWIVFALFASLFWGLNYVLAERIFSYKISPLTLVGIEMFIGGAAFLAISAFHRLGSELTAISADRTLVLLLIAALISTVTGNLLIATSIQSKNATLAGLIEISYPLFIAAFSYLLFGINYISIGVACGGALIFGGVVVIYLVS